jgi:DNA polymerase-3 subunit delta
MPSLTQEQLRSEWESGKLRPVYYLCGEEKYLKERAMELLLSRLKPDAFNFSEFAAGKGGSRQAILQAMTPPMAAERRLVVLRGADKANAEELDGINEYLSSPNPEAALVIISDRKQDKADPLYDACARAGAAASFKPLFPAEAASFFAAMLQRDGLTVSREAAAMMVELAGTDSLALRQEAEKLALLRHGSKGHITEEDIAESAGFSRELGPFELSNAVMEKDRARAADVLDRMLADGEEPLGILYRVSGSLERLLRFKKQGTGQYGGWGGGYMRAMSSAARLYGEEKLAEALRLCLEAETLLKSSSGRDPALTLRGVLYSILK